MNKEFEYKGRKFNISIHLGTGNATRFRFPVDTHTIIVTEGSKYSKSYNDVSDDVLEVYIDMVISDIKKYVDDLTDLDNTVEMLKRLGFK